MDLKSQKSQIKQIAHFEEGREINESYGCGIISVGYYCLCTTEKRMTKNRRLWMERYYAAKRTCRKKKSQFPRKV